MKKALTILLLIAPCFLLAQFGIKGGINFANVTKASSINNSSKSGFHAGIFLAPESKGVIGSRTELIFSRQGYNFKTNSNTGNVNLDYIMLPQYMTINITKIFQLQLGGQMALLLNARADSSSGGATVPGPAGKMMDFYNKFDFGYGGGLEIHPVSGLIIGARVNISLGNLYKDISATNTGEAPSFVPKVNVKNNVFQFFAGWRFGKTKK
ncbi:MAG: PorT family protein [Chitinophagaceae bacterium]|nr:PorT family protein [Chitinophagaceae bacterium]